jgi:hypothetical protein
MRIIRSDKYCHFMTILDKVLTDGESTGFEERAGGPQPYPRGFQEWEGGVRNSTVVDFVKVLQQ